MSSNVGVADLTIVYVYSPWCSTGKTHAHFHSMGIDVKIKMGCDHVLFYANTVYYIVMYMLKYENLAYISQD